MKVYKNFDLTNYNSYKIRANCDTAYFPEKEEDVVSFFALNKAFILLGSGHNIILSKEHYQIPIVLFNGNYNKITQIDNGLLEIEAGAMMWDVAKFALEKGLSGLEIFWDIPSTLGGAVVMNAGASGEEIKDVLHKVRYLDLSDNLVKEISNEDISFEYRNSFFQKNSDKIVLKAWLKLHNGNKVAISEKMQNLKSQRWAKQPTEFPNAGSVFKRPKGYYVGRIIDELGIKGFSIGGAMVSEKHGGFIINFNNCKGKDIIELIYFIQSRVRDVFGIELEIEQRII